MTESRREGKKREGERERETEGKRESKGGGLMVLLGFGVEKAFCINFIFSIIVIGSIKSDLGSAAV